MKKVHVIFIAIALFGLSCENYEETCDEIRAIVAEGRIYHVRVIDLDGDLIDKVATPIAPHYVMSIGCNSEDFVYGFYGADVTLDTHTIPLKDIVNLELIPDVMRGDTFDILVVTVDS